MQKIHNVKCSRGSCTYCDATTESKRIKSYYVKCQLQCKNNNNTNNNDNDNISGHIENEKLSRANTKTGAYAWRFYGR